MLFVKTQIKKHSLIRKIRNNYHIMTPQDYLFNQRDSILARTPQTKILNVLENSNQGPVTVED